MSSSFLLIVQFVLVAIICVCVLIQKSSSIGLGSYSGSNESLFGAKGPAGFLTKFTFIVAVLFVVNTIALGYTYNKSSQRSVFDNNSVINNILPPKNTVENKDQADTKKLENSNINIEK